MSFPPGDLITGYEQEGVCGSPAACRGLWIGGVYLTGRALLLFYNPQQQCHLLIIGLHSLMAALFLFTAPPPQQSLISYPPSISDDPEPAIETCIPTPSREQKFKRALMSWLRSQGGTLKSKVADIRFQTATTRK